MNKMKIIIVMVISIVVLILVGVFFYKKNSAETEKPGNHMHMAPHEQGVVSVDISYVDGRVHLLLGKQEGDKQSLWHQTSNDQGKTWQQAVNVTSNNAIKFKRGNDARMAVQGNNIIVVWMSKVEGAPHNAGPMVTMRSSDLGQTWQQTTMPADWDGSHGFFALDANVDAVNLVWLDSREKSGKGSQGLRFSQSLDGGATWSANKTLDQQTCACCWNTVKFSQNGNFYVLYRDKQPSDMALGKLDSQLNWQRVNTVGQFNWEFEGCPHIGGGLAIDNTRQQIHATVSTGQPDVIGLYYLRSSDMGNNWTTPIPLGGNSAVHSDIAVNSNGDVLAVWDRITENGMQIVSSGSLDNGNTWSSENLLSAIETNASHPKVLAMDKEMLVVWTENTDGGDFQFHTLVIPSQVQ